jgi:EmrB/QacA subfamily drug resistance transporter
MASAAYVVVLDSIGVSVAFARIEAAFPDSSRATLAWVSTGFSIALASLLLLGGRLADRYGRRRIFLAGTAIYALGATASIAAPTVGILIAARVAGGAGGAMMTATAIALALPQFPPEHRGLAMGWLGAAGALASILGPVLGANLVDLVGWRGAFGMALPFCVLVLVFGRRVLEETEVSADAGGLDLLSVTIGTTAVALFTLAVIQGRSWGWTATPTLVAFGASAVLLSLFLYRSATAESPVLRLSVFTDRRFAVATLAQSGTQLGIFAWFFATPLFLQNVWMWSTVKAGWVLAAAMTLGFISIPAGRWADRRGYWGVLVMGALIASGGMVWWVVVLTDGAEPWTGLLPGLFLFGLGAGFVGLPGTGAALVSVDDTELGMANAAHQTIRRLVQAMGVAVAVAVLGSRSADSVTNFKWVWAVTGAGYLFSALVIFVAYPRKKT